MRAAVFLMSSMLLLDSIDTRTPVANGGDSSAHFTFVKAADEPGSDDWEGRFSGTAEVNLCKAPLLLIDFASPFTIVKANFSHAVSHFKSVPSELPSPPPKG